MALAEKKNTKKKEKWKRRGKEGGAEGQTKDSSPQMKEEHDDEGSGK